MTCRNHYDFRRDRGLRTSRIVATKSKIHMLFLRGKMITVEEEKKEEELIMEETNTVNDPKSPLKETLSMTGKAPADEDHVHLNLDETTPPEDTTSPPDSPAEEDEENAKNKVPRGLRKVGKYLTYQQIDLAVKLCELGQSHLFDAFESKFSPAIGRMLGTQLEAIDKEYTDGGIEGYLKNARRLLEESSKGVNPLEGWEPSVPQGQLFELGTTEYDETEALGLQELGSVGFVLVAGGLGERLGYNGIKVGLPTELCTRTCYLQHYIEYILAVQTKYGNGNKLPLCIMTSVDTNDATIKLLKKNNFFGMESTQISIVQQGYGVPALADNTAKIAINGDDPYKILTKPHGHGDIHKLLHKKGIAKSWKAQGLKYLVLFQDTNGLAFHTLPLMLGVSKKLDLLMNSLAVPRKAKQAIGAITKLTNVETGETRTINVEYNQLDPLLRATAAYKDGDINEIATGFSPFPGNINQLLFELDGYVQVLERTQGLMPEFVNPKYADETKTTFKKPTRLECMMQDFPSVLIGEETKRVGFTSISADLCFSPVKNATEDGVKLQAQGVHPGSAATGEADQYGAFRKMLRSIGCFVDDAETETFRGIEVAPGPQIILKPDFACCPAELKAKFPSPFDINISPRSTLIVRGRNVVIRSLQLDGALVIDYSQGDSVEIKDLKVINDGWEIVRDEGTKDEVTRMRGYKLERHATYALDDHGSACVIT